MLNMNLTEGISDYQTEGLTQWDADQVLQISGVTYETTPAVHFANKKSDKALVVTPTVSSGVLTVDIPNSLLRQPYPIVAYIYSYDKDSGSTNLRIRIPVTPRVEPDDYIFPGDTGFITLASINSKVDTLISESTTKVNNLIGNGESRLNTLITTKTQEIDSLIQTKTEELDTLKTDIAKDILNKTYPIGSIYTSVNSADPSTIFGGKWDSIGGKFLLGADATYTAGSTGGEATHTLTTAEMPAHKHNLSDDSRAHSIYWGMKDADVHVGVNASEGAGADNNLGTKQKDWAVTGTTGKGAAHNNMPPYLVVYMWKRTA